MRALVDDLADELGRAEEAGCSFVRSMFRGEPDPAGWAFVEQEIESTPSYAGVPLWWDHCAQDWRDVLPRIDVPTLVIGCEGSHLPPPLSWRTRPRSTRSSRTSSAA